MYNTIIPLKLYINDKGKANYYSALVEEKTF
jgi:hypothetical protein